MSATLINEIEWKALAREAGWALVMLVPAALTLFLGFRSGGFYPGATASGLRRSAVNTKRR